MTVPSRTPLGSSTTNRKWYLDVDTSLTSTPTWVGVFGLTDFKPLFEGNFEDDSDMDGGGYQSETKTAEKWGVDAKVARKTQVASPTAYDPGQEFLRNKAIGKMGVANSAHVRFYEMEPNGPRTEAYEGRAAVDWSPEGGDMKALSSVTLKLRGQGKVTPITHPEGTGPADYLMIITGAPTGGTYTLSVIRDGVTQTTAAIAFGATTAAIQSALEALSNVEPGEVTVGAAGGTGGNVTRVLDWSVFVTMAAAGSFTGGTSPAITITGI